MIFPDYDFMDSSTPSPDHHRHHHGEPTFISGPCPLPSQNNEGDVSATTITPDQQIRVRVSGTDIRLKEVILVSLALLLLVFSVALFFKHWRKNYWDINQLPYYAYLYKTDDPVLLPSTPAPQSMDTVPIGGEDVCAASNVDGLSPSNSFFIRGQGGSCHSSLRLDKNGFSRESRSSLRLDSKPSSFVSRRHSSSTRRTGTRSSFVHVTAEAMQKLSLNRMNSASITGFHHPPHHIRHQTFHSPPWGAVGTAEPRLRRCQSGVDRRSRLHGTTGFSGGLRWTTTRRRYRKTSLNDMSDFESTDTGDDIVRGNVIALRDLRRRGGTSNDEEVVIERDEDEGNVGGHLRIIVASPPQASVASSRKATKSAQISLEDAASSSDNTSPENRRHFLTVHEAII